MRAETARGRLGRPERRGGRWHERLEVGQGKGGRHEMHTMTIRRLTYDVGRTIGRQTHRRGKQTSCFLCSSRNLGRPVYTFKHNPFDYSISR